MKRTIIALVLALSACGESTGAKLDQCKAETKAEFKQSLATARQEGDKQAKALLKPGDPVTKDAMEQIKKMNEDMRTQMEAAAAKAEQAIDAGQKKWQGAAGLAECEKALAAYRKVRGLVGR
jgi:Tfp pilus assembly protein PilP